FHVACMHGVCPADDEFSDVVLVTHRPCNPCTLRCHRLTRGRTLRLRTGRASSPSFRISRSSCHPSQLRHLLSTVFYGVAQCEVQTSLREVESRAPARLGGAARVHGGGRDSIDVPRRRTGRRRAVFGGEGVSVHLRGPTLPDVLISDRTQFVGAGAEARPRL